MTKHSDLPTASPSQDAVQRRDRAQRLRRRITATVAATGVGAVATFGILAADHNAGAAAVASTTAGSAATAAPAAAAPTVVAATAAPTAVTPTMAPATAAPTTTAAPTAQAVTGGSGG
ncbi:MAG: hypothetical protein M3Z57_09510 [Candidatus Dormibacteraeota bacterium]|nr:hypothetical protein [Candidatus Dormibacteraeota bacterium]